ncbi:TIGR02099 family protein [Shewanella electrodiphila]|uniref:TIGR02099 family protein n=1 Tax=Shewanella electrodiphila TaxID=934143 RepID=A0ABT0KR92_9GAMM|nr:TIGR02099 family protein [Shewanella electrodiphila]
MPKSKTVTVCRFLFQIVAVVLVLFALAVSLIRGLLPQLPEARYEVINYLRDQYQVEVQVGKLSAEWQAFGPALTVNNLVVPPQQALPVTIIANKVHFKLDFWQTLLTLSPKIETVKFDGIHVALNVDELSTKSAKPVSNTNIDWLYALLLEQLEYFSISDGTLQLLSHNHDFRPIYISNFIWHNGTDLHQGKGFMHLDSEASASERLALRVDLNGDGYNPDELIGQIYLSAESLDLGEWASRQHEPLLKLDNIEFEGVVNLEAWLGIEYRTINTGLLMFEPSWLQWNTAGEQQRFAINGGALKWQPNETGWQVSSHDLDFSTNGESWPELKLSLKTNYSDLSVSINEIAPEVLTPLLPLIPKMGEKGVAKWRALSPQGLIGPLQLLKEPGKPLLLKTEVKQLQWLASNNIPGSSAIDFNLSWANGLLNAEFPQQDYRLDFQDGFEAPLALTGEAFQVQYSVDNSRLTLPNVHFHNPDIDIAASMQLDMHNAAHLALSANVAISDVDNAGLYFPLHTMSDNLVDYLNASLLKGEIPDAKIVWHGQLNQFPYQDNSGIFQAGFNLNDGAFSFQPTWPAVDDLSLYALFENAAMDLVVNKGNLLDVSADGAHIYIPHMGKETTLRVEANVGADADAAKAVIDNSPLKTSISPTLNVVQISGDIVSELDLTIPLYEGGKADNKGIIKFNGNSVYVTTPGLQLEKVTGNVEFNNAEVNGLAINANLFEQPLTFDFATEPTNTGDLALTIDLAGQWDLDTLPSYIDNPLSEYYSGNMAWDGAVTMIFDPTGYRLQVQVNSDLVGTSLSLPAPFYKDADQAKVLRAELVGDNKQSSLGIKLGKDAEFWGGFNEGNGGALAHYDLLLGRHFKLGDKLAKDQGHIQIDLPEAELTQWLPIISKFTDKANSTIDALPESSLAANALATATADTIVHTESITSTQVLMATADAPANKAIEGTDLQVEPDLKTELTTAAVAKTNEVTLADTSIPALQSSEPQLNEVTAAPKSSFFPPLILIDAKIGSLNILSQNFNQLSFSAKPLTHVWRFDIQSEQLDGHVDFYPSWREQGLKIVASKLHLSPKVKSAEEAEFTPGNLLENLPPLAVDVDDFKLYQAQLGHLVLQGIPYEDGYRFQTLTLTRPIVSMQASGDWTFADGKSLTTFDVNVEASKFDALSDALGINPGLKDAPVNMVGEFSWQGAPYAFSLETLNGKLRFDMGKGYLSEISDKGARIFSLFSLDSLVRKLSLDFSDVFGKGLYFDSFGGSLNIDNGVVKTTDTEMDAIAGNMKVRGYTDLTSQSLNYDIRFIPQLASSVPTVVLLSTSAWTLGLGAFALTKVLEPVIEVISEIRFRLGGTMTDPQLEELERKSKEIEIPESILPKKDVPVGETPLDSNDGINVSKSDNAIKSLNNGVSSDEIPTTEVSVKPELEPEPEAVSDAKPTLDESTSDLTFNATIEDANVISFASYQDSIRKLNISQRGSDANQLITMPKQSRRHSQSGIYRLAA